MKIWITQEHSHEDHREEDLLTVWSSREAALEAINNDYAADDILVDMDYAEEADGSVCWSSDWNVLRVYSVEVG